MAKSEPPANFVEFVSDRSDALLRSAWLLTGDLSRAEDLLQTALTKAWRKWGSIERVDDPEAYVRRVIFTTYVSLWRRRWRSEVPGGDLPDVVGNGDVAAEVEVRDAVLRALSRLSRLSRAIVVLRYVDDKPVAEVAELLRCTPQTVKTLASRAMNALRNDPHLKLFTLQEATE